jgi:ribulose-phosphate 3-epimerase
MDASETIARLRQAWPVIAPSLLASDFSRLRDEIQRLEAAGVHELHLDIMDGHFVPNISFGFPVIEAIRRCTKLPLDVHLMISEPAKYIERFRKAGADLITFHVEAVPEPRPLLRQIRDLGAVAGLTLNPSTPLATVEPYLPDCDLVLVMSVEAGFGGQAFEPQAVGRLRQLRSMAPPEMLLSVDGGVNPETIGGCSEAGSDVFVIGSAFFSHSDYAQTLAEYEGLAAALQTTSQRSCQPSPQPASRHAQA